MHNSKVNLFWLLCNYIIYFVQLQVLLHAIHVSCLCNYVMNFELMNLMNLTCLNTRNGKNSEFLKIIIFQISSATTFKCMCKPRKSYVSHEDANYWMVLVQIKELKMPTQVIKSWEWQLLIVSCATKISEDANSCDIVVEQFKKLKLPTPKWF